MQGTGENPGRHLTAILNAFTRIAGENAEATNEMASRRIVALKRGQDIISEGEEPRTVNSLCLTPITCTISKKDSKKPAGITSGPFA